MKAFVAGATGLTGRHVVGTLVGRGIATVAHVRPDSPRAGEWRARWDALGATTDATAWESDALSRSLVAHAPTMVFALLGTTQARVRRVARAGGDASRETYDAVDVGLTVMLLAAARAVSPAPRVVYLSSIGAGDGARGAYLEARTRVERLVRESGVPYTIARPSLIVGDRDDVRPSERLFAPLADASLGLLGALGARRTAARYRSITGEALARALVSAALSESWRDRVAEADDLQALARTA